MTSNTNTAVPLGERIFGVCVLLYASTAFIRLLMGPEEFGGVGDEVLESPIKKILWATTYIVAACLLAKRYRPALAVLRKMPLLLLLIGYVGVSALWSQSREISILSVAALTGNSLVGLYFGMRYGIAEFLRLLGWVYGIIAISAVLAPVVIGSQATVGGFWNGFFAGKNSLGMNATVGFLVFVMLARSAKRQKWLYKALAALCAVLVLLSDSTTCIVLLSVLAFAMAWRFFAKKFTLSAWAQILIFLCLMAIALSFWQRILVALESSETFMGRLEMWAILIAMVKEKFLLGYGYGGFWVFGGPAQTIWDTFGLDPQDASYAHNGYMQVLVDGGVIGLGLLLGLLFSLLQKARTYSAVTKNTWPVYFVAFLLFHNLTEGTFVARNNICWLLLVAVLVQLVRALPAEASPMTQASQAVCPQKV